MIEVVKNTILTRSNELNIYRGCSYGCLYCDCKLKNSDVDIEAVINAKGLLSLELSDKEPKMLIMGKQGDPYNNYEEKLELTRGALEVIRDFGFGVTIYTKSGLIKRDIDLLRQINERAKCVVVMYISTTSEETRGRLEPKASSIASRIEVLKMLRELRIPSVIKISPFLPYINDTEVNLKKILEIARDYECRGIIYYGPGIMLRDSSKKYFYEGLGKSYPLLKKRYLRELKGKSYLALESNIQSFDYIIKDFCTKNNLIYDLDEMSYYLNNFDMRNLQLSLF